jgi:hypothetical protein
LISDFYIIFGLIKAYAKQDENQKDWGKNSTRAIIAS